MQHRRVIWLGLTLAILLGVLWDFYPLPNAEDRLAQLRASGPNFSSEDLALTPTEQAVLAKAKVVHRRYEFDGRTVFVTVIDGTENRHAVHDPGYCFRGAGWEAIGQKTLSIPGGHAVCFSVRRKSELMDAVYWFSDGRQRHTSFPRYWWQTTLRRITLGRSGPEPVLVVLQSDDRDRDWPTLVPKMIEALSLAL